MSNISDNLSIKTEPSETIVNSQNNSSTNLSTSLELNPDDLNSANLSNQNLNNQNQTLNQQLTNSLNSDDLLKGVDNSGGEFNNSNGLIKNEFGKLINF